MDQANNLRVRDAALLLERDGPKGATIQSVNTWMKTKILDAKIHAKLDQVAHDPPQELQQLPVCQVPSLTRFLVEWGMEPAQAARYKDKEATKLLVILNELRK